MSCKNINLASSLSAHSSGKRAVLASTNNLLSILREFSLKRQNWTLLLLNSSVLGFFFKFSFHPVFCHLSFYLASSNWFELYSCQKDNDCVLKLICTNKA